ncbi:rhodanese-like domain-containing protein [Tomitella fengzijianii]|uniref:Rhodanese-like domain-containing protein n=1 Tax=Tomitella fengzijianii TaxID=2597660 RepID=A0A516X787_9ACTN|nr:rhodanese-like domain-containing protein [Tomitella fengzijianii]
MSAAELPERFDDATVLLDVRERDEWDQGHVAGAVHMPLGEVSERLDEVDPDAEVYVVCRQGGRAVRVCQFLNQYGRDVVFVRDGMVGWQQSGRPTVAADGSEGSVY